MINLVVQGVINNKDFLAGKIWEVIVKCRDLAGLFNHSNHLKEKLREIMDMQHKNSQSTSHQPKYCSLKQDVPTRWNSTYQLLNSVLVCQHGVRKILTDDQKVWKDHGSKMLTSDDLKFVEDLCQVLLPFNEFTEFLSGAKYVTISVVLPTLNNLMELLKGAGCEWPSSVGFVVDELYEDLKKRSMQYFENDAVVAATYLDQLFKKFLFIK